jgi:hypothetical protein
MQTTNPVVDDSLYQEIRQTIADNSSQAYENLNWLKKHMHNYFFLSNRDEVQAIAVLLNGNLIFSRLAQRRYPELDDVTSVYQAA